MYAQILILKDLWKRVTNVDNPRVTLAMSICLTVLAHVLCGCLIFFNFILSNSMCLNIISVFLYIVMIFLGLCMLHETVRLKRISKDKGYWFWWLDPSYINKMFYSELEECVAWIYTMNGYKCTVLHKHSHEHGADIIAIKENETISLQVKRWQNKVGKSSVDQVLKSKDYYQPTKFIVVTNNQFTKPTHAYAREKGVQLIEHNELLHLYQEAKDTYKLDKRLHNCK